VQAIRGVTSLPQASPGPDILSARSTCCEDPLDLRSALTPLLPVPAIVLLQYRAPHEGPQEAAAHPACYRLGIVRIPFLDGVEVYPALRIGLSDITAALREVEARTETSLPWSDQAGSPPGQEGQGEL